VTPARTPTKDAIRAAAQRLFPEKGYAGTTVRDIAAEAGCDPALIIRHFGSKESLFLDVMSVATIEQPLAQLPLENLGERFITYVLDSGDDVRRTFLALLRASDSEGVAPRLREMHEAAFVAPLAARLDGPDAALRARLAAALVGGLLYSMWVVGDEELLAADHPELVRRYGALLQTLITP
jgi:AcrR family transcriptional regulator